MFQELIDFFEKKLENQKTLLDYIDQEDESIDQKLIILDYIEKSSITKDPFQFKDFLMLLAEISNYHLRTHENKLMLKIENILFNLKDKISHTFNCSQLFKIFHDNNRILLFLHNNSLINFEENIIQQHLFSSVSKICYFYPELKKINEAKFLSAVKSYHLESFIQKYEAYFDDFLKNRVEGENESYLSWIVRNDIIDEFVQYTEKNGCTFSDLTIERSFFENKRFISQNDISQID